MTYKPNLSRKARLAAGSRLPAPGQDPLREEELRIELTEEFKPESLIEGIWIEDIAYRVAAIEVIRAQIAGFRYRMMRTTYGSITAWDATTDGIEHEWDDRVYSAYDRTELTHNFHHEFMAPERVSLLNTSSFAVLLGAMDQGDLAQLRQLQVYEHEEVRERDRIVNQFERRRRQAMRHAIEMVEARHRAGLVDETAAPALLLSNDNSNGSIMAASAQEPTEADTADADEDVDMTALVDEDAAA